MYMYESALKIPNKYKKLLDTVTSRERYSGSSFNLFRIAIRIKEISNIINEEIYINHLFLSFFYKLIDISKLMILKLIII